MPAMTICLQNRSKTDLGVHLDDLCSALQKQNTEHVTKYWNCPVTFVVAAIGGAVPTGSVVMQFTDDDPPEPGAEGDHEVDSQGNPVINIWVPATLKAGDLISVTASHESIEDPADPSCTLCAQDSKTGWFWPIEPCDAVETESYEIDGVKVSNFVFPDYFRRPENGEPAKPLDWLEIVKQPFTVMGGGYSSVWKKRGWSTVWGPDEQRAMRRHALLPKVRKKRRERIQLIES